MQTPEEQEKEANLFARCLLMPEEWIRSEIDTLKKSGCPCDIEGGEFIKKMARKFQVSETMMAFRLGEIFT